MSTVKKFEDLLAWQKGRELTRSAYEAREEFLNYLYIAKGSAGEVRAQVYAAYDIGYLNIETFKSLKDLAEQGSKLLLSFILGVKRGAKPDFSEKARLAMFMRKFLKKKALSAFQMER